MEPTPTTATTASPTAWSFAPRWREKLLCRSLEGELRVRLTMGPLLHVHFPTAETWQREAPGWAKEQRGTVLRELRRWCEENGIPLSIEPGAPVDG